MKRTLNLLEDRGCWISDDRLYAFVSARGGVSEIGYHGSQPVSRNSRILVHESGVFLFCVRSVDGAERQLVFNEVEWTPGKISSEFALPEGKMHISLRASGRNLYTRWSGSFSSPVVLVVRVSKDICFAGVQGERIWQPPYIEKNSLFLGCRDRILLRQWLERKGPYAGDFLIPEPWRRVIFEGKMRSGLATPEDLRPMFRHLDLPLYDATVSVRIGGSGFTVSETPDEWIFEYLCSDHSPVEADLVVQCGELREELILRGEAPPPETDSTASQSGPRLFLEGFPRWMEFFASVPALVDSCCVRDFGVPRACPGRYYWLWSWDMLVTVPEAFRWGEPGLGESTTRFVNTHRDVNGIVPARWTRSLLPLDTPSPGGIEFLFGALAYENFLETGRIQEVLDAYPSIVPLLSAASSDILESGIVKGEGFYPDLLSFFGRNEQSAVSMEVGSWYSLCRLLQNIARSLGDQGTERLAESCAAKIMREFDYYFWDEKAGFFVDSFQTATGLQKAVHPIFALLFLHSPLGLSLIRSNIDRTAAYVAERLLMPEGMRTIPLEESRRGGEVVLDSWYPHWDVYALQLLRRAGYAEKIMAWLRQSEKVLAQLGYCPEFLSLQGFRENEPDAWSRHGAASNLNCVTAWYRAIRESIFGIEIDPGGMTHLPLPLPIGRIAMEGMHWRGGLWTIEVIYDGPHVEEIRVDDSLLTGLLKVPARFAAPGEHHLKIRYGDRKPEAHFVELVNAEIVNASRSREQVEIEFNPLGFVDGTFFSPIHPVVSLDGKPIDAVWDEKTGKGFFSFNVAGKHLLRLGK